MDTEKTKATPEQAEVAAKPAFWAVLPAAVRYDDDLPPNAKLLYAEISALTDQRGYCYASNEYFMRLYGLGERTIRRLLSELQRRGFVAIADGDGGKDRRKIYAGINPLAGNPAKNGREPGQNFPGNPAKNGPHNKKENKKENNPPIAPQGGGAEKQKQRRRTRAKPACEYEPQLFERFWKAYPRGEAKAEARYEWDDLRPSRELMMAMSAALDRQKKSVEWLRDNGRAVPYACRWLSHRRWEDDEKTPLLSPAAAAAPAREEEIEWV